MRKELSMIFWPALAGLLAALLILDRWVLDGSVIAGGPQEFAEPASYARAVRRATPSVVNIYTAKLVTAESSPLLEDSFFRRYSPSGAQRQSIERSLGSGVIMSDQGHILTNNHVIAGADAIQVMLHDGRSASAVVIGSDSATDLAVLRVQLQDLQPVKLGDSDQAQVGDVVLAIGNPLGFGHSVTQGIVSAMGRYGLQLSTYENYIQTDASIHLGNSGGALIDTQGRLLGINTLIYTANSQSTAATTGIGISLAIPVNLATFVMNDLIRYGEVIRGWLGVSVEPIGRRMPSGARRESLAVVSVARDSPAQKAGIRIGDVITHINQEPVQDGRLTMHRIARLRPGESVEISVQRDTQILELRTVVGAQNQSINPAG
ncbi:MAG: serine protease DegS [Bacteroidia bacterium]|jgi:serine protease DegS